VLGAAKPLETESVSLSQLVGRVVAEPCLARCDLPRFDNSAVDGYAIHGHDLAAKLLPISRIVAAGDPAGPPIVPGTCLRILTGAPVPCGTDAVAMQEEVDVQNGSIHLREPARSGSHIRRRAEEVLAGNLVVGAGRRATPGIVAAIAAAGIAHVQAHRIPRVGVLSTGSELAAPGQVLSEAQVYESNTYGLSAWLGNRLHRVIRVQDDPETTKAALGSLFDASCDVVVTSGGVSVGDRDVVRPALAGLGVETNFWGVAIKPGKPLFFGSAPGGALVFGLPGNPLSAMITFRLFVLPLLARLEGESSVSPRQSAQLSEPLVKTAGRLEFVPCCRGEGNIVRPTTCRGSHMLGGLAEADALILFPAHESHLDAGEEVEIMPLWSVR